VSVPRRRMLADLLLRAERSCNSELDAAFVLYALCMPAAFTAKIGSPSLNCHSSHEAQLKK
jgi:hypothetical protein